MSDQWISPVFDVAKRLLVVEIEHGREIGRTESLLNEQGATSRLQRLVEIGADVLICEAISQPLETLLVSAGVEVIAHTCGPVEDVVQAFISGRLKDDMFVMPGCGGHRRHVRDGLSEIA
jgi:predicted Fe-Mo cluster-binding NifX family protein